MLWTKAWLEMRWRLVFGVGLPLAVVLLMSAPQSRLGMAGTVFLLMFVAIYLASNGIRTQAAFRAARGLHGSTFFTLSLPVSRLRLLAIRAGMGLSATAAFVTIIVCTVWVKFPIMRGDSTPADLFKFVVAAIVCTACFHFVSVLFAAFLDEIWQFSGCGLVIFAAAWIVGKLSLPSSANVFAFWGKASPLVTHTFPWPAMAISVVASAILFFAALKVVQNREY